MALAGVGLYHLAIVEMLAGPGVHLIHQRTAVSRPDLKGPPTALGIPVVLW